MSRSPARKAPPSPAAPRRAAPRVRQAARPYSRVRNATAGQMVDAASARARRYAPRKTNPLTKENIADAAAAIAGGIGTAVVGGYLADKWDPRITNGVTAGVVGTASLFTEKGGWRTFLQSVASASAGQAALAVMADLDATPAKCAKEPEKVAVNDNKPAAPAAKPAQPTPAPPGKRNAMPSAAMDRAFARSEARIAQVLADDGYDA
jgi:hypothetical protein